MIEQLIKELNLDKTDAPLARKLRRIASHLPAKAVEASVEVVEEAPKRTATKK